MIRVFCRTLHVNKYLDLYAGVNRGVNMTFSDNNSSVAFEGGFGLNLLDGNLTVVALTHDRSRRILATIMIGVI